MPDQIIDAAMARSVHEDAVRTHPLSGWIVMRDPPGYPGKFTARLVTDKQSIYVLVADILAEIQSQLPPRLLRSDRRVADLPELVEIWFTA